MKSISLWMLVLFISISCVESLTGHVCRRQVAETYMTTYDRAFICPERYTTSCGQLDWRRCTKYRVNTCYTPTEKYAVRYKITEGCCPGWRDNGNGQCSTPDCGDGCLNEGTCSAINGIPECLCKDGFHGYRCEHEKSTMTSQNIALLVAAATIAGGLAGIAIHLYRKYSRSIDTGRIDEGKEERKRLIGDDADGDGSSNDHDQNEPHKRVKKTELAKKDRPKPSAPALED